MRFVKNSLAIAVGLSLSACGGGGGGSATLGGTVRSDVPFYQPVRVNGFKPLSGTGNQLPISEIYTQDLNNDRVDEVVIGGRMTQPATVQTWRDTYLQIFGFNSGSFTNETNMWLPNDINQIVGSEPAVRFGDFNGDGHKDMLVAPSTDMSHYGPGVVYWNTGSSSFTRQNIALDNVWAHDATVTDFNRDGIDDFLLTDYNGRPVLALGSSSGNLQIYQSTGTWSGSGVTAGDFLGDGSVTVIKTDSGGGNTDTKLFSWNVSGGDLRLTQISVLPASRFWLPKWDSVRASWNGRESHDIRVVKFDFNHDGRQDVIVFSTMPKGNNAHGYSELQFLRNDGSGTFVDVTDSVLTYDNQKTTAYNPVIVDMNNDGLMDILLSVMDYSGQPSSSVLIQTKEGRYIESYGSVLTAFHDQIRSMTANAIGSNNSIGIVSGPDNTRYLIGTVFYDRNGDTNTAVYLSRIGSNGTTTPQATVATMSQIWPWMSAADVNATLNNSVVGWLDGLPILDPMLTMRPIGGLGITSDGRLGKRQEISGVLAVPGLDPRLLSDVTALDSLGRNFSVDLSGMLQTMAPAAHVRFTDAADRYQTWSTRFVAQDLRMDRGFDAQGDAARWTTGARFPVGGPDSNTSASVSASHMPGSPWMAISGVWGQINSTTTLDSQVSRVWSKGWWTQAGLMQTTTDLSPGMVRHVSPIWAAYSVIGWQDDHWTVYGGTQPTIVHGKISLNLPGQVDDKGVLHYNNVRTKIRNPLIGFTGVEHRWKLQSSMIKLSAQVNQSGQYQTRLTYGYQF